MVKSQEVKTIKTNIYCYLCKKEVRKEILLCNSCNSNPFFVEDLRKVLSSKKQFKEFVKTYSNNYSQIKNPNTKRFWNTKFLKPISFREQDKMTQDKINTIIDWLPEDKFNLLDIAIGQAYIEERLVERNKDFNLYGIDISSTAIKRVQKKYKGDFIVGDIFNIGSLYDKDQFDIIIALELIEHISPHKIFDFYKLVNSKLKKGGVFIISTPLNEGLRHRTENPSGHVRDYSISTLKAELTISKFIISDIRVFYAFNKYYQFKKILTKILINKYHPNNVVIKAIKK